MQTILETTASPRFIVGIFPDSEEEAQCIRIAHPSRMYLTDDYIPTHNSWEPESESLERAATMPRQAFTFDQARKEAKKFQGKPKEENQSFRDTERAYGGRTAYEKAKESGRTKLDYRQWVQVRTPEFRAWFGDWEVQAGRHVSRTATTFDEAREKAKEFKGKPLTNTITGMEAVVSRNNLDKMLSEKSVGKSGTPATHSLAVANLDHLFERAILGWSKSDAKGDINVKAIHRFFAPMARADGHAVLAKLTVKETIDQTHKSPLYTVEAVEFNEKSPAAQWVGEAARLDGIPETTRSVGDVQSLAQRVQDFNPDSVSKAIDPETFEPLPKAIDEFPGDDIQRNSKNKPGANDDLLYQQAAPT